MNDIKTHKSSKIVILRRAPMSIVESTATSSKDAEAQAYFDSAHRSIGSYWPKGSMRPGTGMTLNEENFLMPFLLNIPNTDRDFREKSTQFFHDISTKVEPDGPNGSGGTKLEIGLTDNGVELGGDLESGEKNLPLNISDYVRWRQVSGHPAVALSREDAKGNQLKHYYIDDPAESTKHINAQADIKDLAMSAYLEIKADAGKVRQYLTLLKINTSDPQIKGQETVKLRELAVADPKKFMEVHNDKEKNARYLLSELVSAGVLEEVGSRLLIKENRVQIGATLKDAIAYIRDPENGKQVTIFKAQVQDWRKKRNPSLAELDEESAEKNSGSSITTTTE